MGKRNDNIAVFTSLLIVIVLGLLLAMYAYAGPDPAYDDATYILQAHYMAMGNFYDVLTNVFTFSFMEVVPYAISFYLFGYGTTQAVVASLCEYFLLIILTFLLAKRIIDKKYAVLAAFFTAITPFVVLYATRVLPDMILGIFIALALYFYASTKKNKLDYFVLGIILSLSIYAKTEAFAFLGFFGFFIFVEIFYRSFRHNRKGSAASYINNSLLFGSFVLGILIGLFVYFFIYYIYVRSPFFIFTHYTFYPGDLFSNIMMLNPFTSAVYFLETFSIGLLFYFFIAGGVVAILKKNTKAAIIFSATFFFVLYLIFGSSSLTNYVVVSVSTRFFAAVVAPLATLSAYLVREVSNKAFKITGSSIIKYLSMILLVLAIVLYDAQQIYLITVYYNSAIEYKSTIFHDAARYIENTSNAPTYVYCITGRGFNIVSISFSNFEFKFNRNYTALSIFPNESYGAKGMCNESILQAKGISSFLFGINLNASNNSYVKAWLDNSCSLSFVKQYGSKSNFFIDIYRVYPTKNISQSSPE